MSYEVRPSYKRHLEERIYSLVAESWLSLSEKIGGWDVNAVVRKGKTSNRAFTYRILATIC